MTECSGKHMGFIGCPGDLGEWVIQGASDASLFNGVLGAGITHLPVLQSRGMAEGGELTVFMHTNFQALSAHALSRERVSYLFIYFVDL